MSSTNRSKSAYDTLRAILEVAPFGIYVVNRKGRIEYVNTAMAVISGDTHEQLTSLNVFRLSSYKRSHLDRKIRSVFTGNSFSADSVKWISHHSKKSTIQNIIGIPIKEDDEKKALIFVEDVTLIKKAEEEMKKAMEIKSQFISIGSHELRSPLTLVSGYVEFIASGKAGELNDKQKECLGIVKTSTDRLVRLVNEVLNFQKLEAGHMTFKIEKGDINKLVEEVAVEIMPLAKEKGLTIRTALTENLLEIGFDRDKIKQVLINFINNAIKFTDKGGITITTSKGKDGVRVSVADTGLGIKNEDLRKLFRGFSQIDDGKKINKSGTGLGLAIAKKIIDGHRGKVEVHSAYGKGSEFSFFLKSSK